MSVANAVRVWNFSEAAETFSVKNDTITDFVRARGWKTLPVPRNRKARGLDADQMRQLAAALGLEWNPS